MAESNALGHNDLDSIAIKMAGDQLALPLRHIINLSLSQGKFCKKWKFARLVPRLKSKSLNKMQTSSYHPVAILTVTSKLVEKAGQSQLLSFLEQTEQLNQSNHAYRAQLSMTTTLLEILDELYQGTEDRKIGSMMALDQSTAFDCVSHTVLMRKLEKYKIGTAARAWVQYFLLWCTQYVVIGKSVSRMEPVYRGVPQGSVLGPLLYAVYLNELTEAVKRADCTNTAHADKSKLFRRQCSDCGILTSYADNTMYTVCNKKREDNEERLKSSLEEITLFLRDNQLSINLPKTTITECMLKLRKGKTTGDPPSLLVEGELGVTKLVKDTKCMRILGANMQSNLGWQQHLETGEKAVFPRMRRQLGLLKNRGRMIPRNVRNSLARSYITSSLNYLLPLWGGAGTVT